MRLIDAEALEEKIRESIGIIKRNRLMDKESWDSSIRLVWYKKLLEMVENVPTIEAKPIIHARWEERLEVKDEHFECYSIFCSNCKELLYGSLEHSKYCQHCGAQMDEKEDD